MVSTDPKVWGPHYWFVIDSLVSQTNDSNFNQICHLIEGLCNQVPCPKCKNHYIVYKQKFPMKFNNKKELIDWLNKFKIQTKRNKPQPTCSGGCGKRPPLKPQKLKYLK